jgi:hypothetical protein
LPVEHCFAGIALLEEAEIVHPRYLGRPVRYSATRRALSFERVMRISSVAARRPRRTSQQTRGKVLELAAERRMQWIDTAACGVDGQAHERKLAYA